MTYDEIISVCPKRLMSRGIALYGMFYPDMEISKYFLYKGKLTKREKSKNYAYYFDEKDRLRLTERYGDHKNELDNLLNIIFFYYYENTTEIVWYNTTEKTITTTGYIDYNNGKISKYVETYNISEVIESNKRFGSYDRLSSVLNTFSFLKIETPVDKSKSIISCKVDGFTSDEFGRILAERGIAVRTGLHCAPNAHEYIGSFPEGLVRFSISCLTKDSDFDRLTEVLSSLNEELI